MRDNCKVLVLVLIFLVLSSVSGLAQSVEVHPYAGGFFAGQWKDQFKLRNQGVYGAKFGKFVSDRVQVEGNLGYMNHFEFQDTSTRSRALIWEVSPSFNFFNNRFAKFAPYATVGLGGVTAKVDAIDGDGTGEDRIDMLAGARPANSSVVPQSQVMSNGDTFLAVSYGGGIKALNLHGPLGFRVDVRGRSLPNFYGNSVSWLETTAGLTFSWGER
jgi:hypothetical protein